MSYHVFQKEIVNLYFSQKEKSKKGKKIPDRGSEENIRNMQRALWTRQYLDNTELSPSKQKKRERKPRPKVVLSLLLPTKILCVGDLFASH